MCCSDSGGRPIYDGKTCNEDVDCDDEEIWVDEEARLSQVERPAKWRDSVDSTCQLGSF